MISAPGNFYEQLRLLPGDRAPPLDISIQFNREDLKKITLDQMSLVTLWNAGCAGCLSSIANVAETCIRYNVKCYGVAIMVRDISLTSNAAMSANTTATLVLEAPSETPSPLSRGLVTRRWLEASGQTYIPLAFLVNEHGIIEWMGNPEEAIDVIPAVERGGWDINSCRTIWQNKFTDSEVTQNRILQELTDASFSATPQELSNFIRESEEKFPQIAYNSRFVEFNLREILKNRTSEEAKNYYKYISEVFKGNTEAQCNYARLILNHGNTNRSLIELVNINLVKFYRSIEEQRSNSAHITDIIDLRLLAATSFKFLNNDEGDNIAMSLIQWAKSDACPNSLRSWAIREANKIIHL